MASLAYWNLFYGGYILDLDHTWDFETEYSQDAETLRISGMVSNGFHVVKSISAQQDRSDLIVEINMVMAPMRNKGRSGTFDHTLDVPPTIGRVLFGEERKEIWRRAQ